jgi:hypothetical protein
LGFCGGERMTAGRITLTAWVCGGAGRTRTAESRFCRGRLPNTLESVPPSRPPLARATRTWFKGCNGRAQRLRRPHQLGAGSPLRPYPSSVALIARASVMGSGTRRIRLFAALATSSRQATASSAESYRPHRGPQTSAALVSNALTIMRGRPAWLWNTTPTPASSGNTPSPARSVPC